MSRLTVGDNDFEASVSWALDPSAEQSDSMSGGLRFIDARAGGNWFRLGKLAANSNFSVYRYPDRLDSIGIEPPEFPGRPGFAGYSDSDPGYGVSVSVPRTGDLGPFAGVPIGGFAAVTGIPDAVSGQGFLYSDLARAFGENTGTGQSLSLIPHLWFVAGNEKWFGCGLRAAIDNTNGGGGGVWAAFGFPFEEEGWWWLGGLHAGFGLRAVARYALHLGLQGISEGSLGFLGKDYSASTDLFFRHEGVLTDGALSSSIRSEITIHGLLSDARFTMDIAGTVENEWDIERIRAEASGSVECSGILDEGDFTPRGCRLLLECAGRIDPSRSEQSIPVSVKAEASIGLWLEGDGESGEGTDAGNAYAGGAGGGVHWAGATALTPSVQSGFVFAATKNTITCTVGIAAGSASADRAEIETDAVFRAEHTERYGWRYSGELDASVVLPCRSGSLEIRFAVAQSDFLGWECYRGMDVFASLRGPNAFVRFLRFSYGWGYRSEA